MPTKPFGEWLPDLPPHSHEGLVTARNVYASPLGYTPVQGFSAITGALPAAWNGSASFIGSDGSTALLAGTSTNLYAYISSTWTSKIATLTASLRWQFAQFGDLVIGVFGGAPQKYNILTATGGTLGGTPPNASMVAIVKDFVFLAGDNADNATVTWSAINNAEGWTAATDQSDYQQIPDGGEITGLVGGEYGLVFQRDAINRFSYVGTPLIFQRDKVSENLGALTPYGIASSGRMVFFLSERGFYMYQDGSIRAIGENKVDSTFFSTYSISDIRTSISCAIDPKKSLVIWSMPGRLWVYNWDLDRWTDIEIDTNGVSVAFTANVSLEDIDTLYPSGIDSVPLSLDDPIFRGGEPTFVVVNSTYEIGALNSFSNLLATIQMPKVEWVKGRNLRIRKARLISDVLTSANLDLVASQRLGDTPDDVVSTTIRDSGDMPIRTTGRFISPKVTIDAGATWTYIQGIDVTGAVGGNR